VSVDANSTKDDPQFCEILLTNDFRVKLRCGLQYVHQLSVESILVLVLVVLSEGFLRHIFEGLLVSNQLFKELSVKPS